MRYFMKLDNPLFFTVAQVRCCCKDGVINKATGFFWEDDERCELYFITNRHVVIDENEGYYPDKIRLTLHRNPQKPNDNPQYTISLYNENDEHVWLEHPRNQEVKRQEKMIDVVAIKLDKSQIWSKYYIESFKFHNYVCRLSNWDDLAVIGYPDGIYDTKNNYPIIRRATLASAPSVPFEKEPKILIDAKLHPGTSGSPVLSPTNYSLEFNYPKREEDPLETMGEDALDAARFSISQSLVGIHSGEFDRANPELGLHNVWLAGLIPDIIMERCLYFDSLGCELSD